MSENVQSYAHAPVLLDEVMAVLSVRPGGRYLDGTFGRGGHAQAILARGGDVLGVDRDEAAVLAGERLAEAWPGRLRVVRGNHGDLGALAAAAGWTAADGVLLDLGVSSPQLDEAARGFSFLREGPLDMRMDRSRGRTAADVVNGGDAAELEEIFRTLGEEPQARRLAKALAQSVAEGRRFGTTTALAEFIERLLGRRGARHPATRAFQALRMAVNDEMGELRRALEGALALLAPGGRLAVITFESLTDRVVKQFFAAHAGRDVSLQQGGAEWRGLLPRVRAVTRGVRIASEAETCLNPRSRSAKLRAVQKE